MRSHWCRPLLLASAFLVSMAAGCTAPVGVTGGITVPPDAATTCATQCEQVGMELGAVAIMANNVGCVCQKPSSTGTSAAISAGMATIFVEDQRNQQQSQVSVSPTIGR